MANMGDDPRPTVEGSILENTVGVPPVFTNLTRQLDKLVEEPLLNPKISFPAGRTPQDVCQIVWMLTR